LTQLRSLVVQKQQELANYVPQDMVKQNPSDANQMALEQKITAGTDQQGLQNGAQSNENQQSTEHNQIVEDLMDQVENLRAKLMVERIDKKALDSKLLESELFQKLVIQVHAVVAYCGYLKERTEKAETNILEIEKMRAFELDDLQIKENEEKLKLVRKNKILEREQYKLREAKSQLQLELQLKINAMRALEKSLSNGGGMAIESQPAQQQNINPNDPRARAQQSSQSQVNTASQKKSNGIKLSPIASEL
jgi:hypothetical protein